MMRLLTLTLFALLIACPITVSQDENWDLMTQKEMKLDAFREAYPDFDGKGVVIAVLDTGVDMGVEGLKELPDGTPKVVDVRDFSGEGDLFWEEGHIVPNGDKGEKIVDSEGRSLTAFREKAEGAIDNRFYMVFLEEKNFKDTSVQDLNGDGDKKDSFGILIFAVKVEEAVRYEAVVDINGDGKLDDGQRLSDYWREKEYFVLAGKEGDRRQLAMALNFYPEEKRLSVHFDTGAHGTHVAGIAAGYKIHGQEGYNGGAPGARVISLKIGNNGYSGGSTTTESIKKAYEYGAKYSKDNKVPVVFNMSFGIGSELEGRSAVDRFLDDLLWKNPGIVVVVSNGNEGPGLSSSGTPSCSKRAIAVGALLSPTAASAQYGVAGLEKEVFFSFSSRGGDTFKPDIVAPGSAASTVPLWGDRDHMHGTSMSSPAAAGAIACIVDGLVRHESEYAIDNAIILRAVKNTGRQLDGWTVLDVGGGVIDMPAAYKYAEFLCSEKENEGLREYRIVNRGPAPGQATAYWRMSPYLPTKHQMMNFQLMSGFNKEMKKEQEARFYRAFDLKPDVDWLSTNKDVAYLKGGGSASIGIMADVEGKGPGCYTGCVKAFRKGATLPGGEEILEFAIPVTVIVPHRTTPENHGTMLVRGEVDPGFVDRVFVEVPAGITAISAEVRVLDGGGEGSSVSTSVYNPEGVGVGRLSARGEGSREGSWSLTGKRVFSGTWEFIVSSSMRSPERATYDLVVSLHGLDVGAPDLAFGGPTTRKRVLVPVRCTQAVPFKGNLEARLEGLVRKEVIEVEETDRFERIVTIDNSTSTASWSIEFDRETYALFTDCVLRLEDPESGATLYNGGLGQRHGRAAVTVPKDQATPKKYRLVLLPAFTKKADSKKWRFVLTEQLKWRSGAVALEPVAPKAGRLSLNPHDWTTVEFLLGASVPTPPAGYAVDGILEAKSSGSEGTIVQKRFMWR